MSLAAKGNGQGRVWQFPRSIKTYIQPNHKRTQMMRHAFAEWTRKTNGKILFKYVSSKKTADIDVQFVNSIPNADREIGLTKSSFSKSNRLYHATIFIAEKTAEGKQLNNDAVYTVMLHEIGHAIGISEHSNDPMSIMFPYEDDRQEILKGDLKDLSEIYGW
jgi:predicted Zn-dependent protease